MTTLPGSKPLPGAAARPAPRGASGAGTAGAGILAGLLICGSLIVPAAPAQAQASAASAAAAAVAPGAVFSAGTPGGPLPAAWKNLPVAHGKALTHYSLVADEHGTVLEADAVASASALMHRGNVDLEATPQLSWRWKIEHPIDNADNSIAAQEDAPARLIFVFDGDKEKLSFGDRTAIQLARTLAGEDLPYATLMYIWSNTAPIGSVIDNPHTSRVKMIVVSGGPEGAGRWLSLSRNVVQDYEHAFHEKPGRVTAYGLLTDTDNTGASARAWYGDIHFGPAK
ncbi:DUF3047 domain-containing protein [Cupriavidus basilensis]|uniref:DUF3047 domain-containing protein n=1 Tax=Cupriavidus basilensis TaxID=68895 RepID=A0ABT6AVX6_9BURK|nr:DUF3047 domain-containing protein [Cupriavidus basilensis]MDF3836783.1 DUF3047 domain-containing protein [Cupriavidus basilensis]